MDSGKREREARRSAGGTNKEDCRKSVVQIGRTEEAGHRERRRPVRSPSSTYSFDRMVQPVRKSGSGVAALAAVW